MLSLENADQSVSFAKIAGPEGLSTAIFCDPPEETEEAMVYATLS